MLRTIFIAQNMTSYMPKARVGLDKRVFNGEQYLACRHGRSGGMENVKTSVARRP